MTTCLRGAKVLKCPDNLFKNLIIALQYHEFRKPRHP
jgi:hypothetical protein